MFQLTKVFRQKDEESRKFDNNSSTSSSTPDSVISNDFISQPPLIG
ncbi:12894_t:CDS:2 [Entrophospora sp. SA101]|nr:12894_t:CDS:2 [Entrophospora sp. SA101]